MEETMTEEERYESVCKPKFEELNINLKDQTEKINKIYVIVTNGLINSVNNNADRIKVIDTRLWFLVGGVIMSILLEILFQVML
jgi:hypothetical protein